MLDVVTLFLVVILTLGFFIRVLAATFTKDESKETKHLSWATVYGIAICMAVFV